MFHKKINKRLNDNSFRIDILTELLNTVFLDNYKTIQDIDKIYELLSKLTSAIEKLYEIVKTEKSCGKYKKTSKKSS